MFRQASRLLALAVLLLPAGWARAGDAAVPATRLIPDDAVLVVQVAEPKALIERAFDPRVVAFVQSLPPYQELLSRPELQPVRTMVDFLQTKYQADVPTMLTRLLGGGITLALGPGEAALLVVDAEDQQMVTEIHDLLRTIASGEAAKQGVPGRVASADYRGITGWTFGPGESHALMGSRLLLANKPEALKAAIDRQLDQTAGDGGQQGGSTRHQAALEALAGSHPVTLFADLAVLKQLPGFQQGLAQQDNPLARLLFAPFLATVSDATWLAAGIDVTAGDVTARVVADRSTAEPDKLHSFALPQEPGEGAMPHPVVPGQIAALSLYRDLHQFYAAKDDLFPGRTSGLIFFENMMGIFFSGMDLTEEVLAETLPDLRVVVAEQRYSEKTGTPAMQLPGVAVIVQLRDPSHFELVMKEAWQKAIGLVNFTRGQQALPGLIIDSATHNGTAYTTAYFSVAREENKEAVDVRFNFQPALAVAGDRLIMSSSDALVRDLIDALQQQREQTVGPVSGRHTLAMVQSGPLAAVLAANRETLVRQNMVEDGKTREEAEQEVAGLLLALKHLTDLQIEAGTQGDRPEMTIRISYDLPQ